MIISGAYGRDYKSKKAVLADWNAGKDFAVRDMATRGAYVNRADIEADTAARSRGIEVRYNGDRSVAMLVPVIAGGAVTGWRI